MTSDDLLRLLYDVLSQNEVQIESLDIDQSVDGLHSIDIKLVGVDKGPGPVAQTIRDTLLAGQVSAKDLLLGAILESEDDCLIVHRKTLRESIKHDLKLDQIGDEATYILTAEPAATVWPT